MLLLVLLLCLITSILVALRRRDRISMYMLGMSVSNMIMLSGVVVYIAKMGGLAATELVFLFFLPRIQHWLQYLPISLSTLGYLVAVGRTLFPFFLLQLAMECSMVQWIRRRTNLMRVVTALPLALLLVYYFPRIFRLMVGNRFWLLAAMIPVSMTVIVLYVAAALLLMVLEYHSTTISFFRRNFRYILLSVVSITALYLIYATKDPAQIYNMFVGEYIRLGITSYISPALSGLGWTVLVLCAVFFVVVGGYGMLRYIQIHYDESRKELSLQKKFDAAGLGVSVFVHGIKNQLLSSRVLHKKLSRVLEAEEPDLEQLKAYAEQLRELNEGMLTRMDELYRTVKNSALSLRPVGADQLVWSSIKRFHGKYPDGEIRVSLGTDRLVLADLGPLSEAIYNLLTNGYEAAVQAGREEPRLELVTRAERMWTVLEVRDNGGGIPPELQNRIYDPFFTSKNTNYNWGMGLYYVRKIVKSHWGLLRLESQPGKGSTFFVMLPLYDADHKE